MANLGLRFLRFLSVAGVLCVFLGVAAADTEVISGVAPSDSGGGEAPVSFEDDQMSPAQEEAIRRQVQENVDLLKRSGRLPEARAAGVLFSWPLQAVSWYGDPGYHGISGFVDHNPAYPGQILDYNCGARTYDTAAAYNHKGVDIFLWPFSWLTMDAGVVQIVAAAAGTIIFKSDGQYDRSCGFNGNPWNSIYVSHADGSVAFYGHMKSGSTTPKNIGDSVAQGEYLGLVGSSGNSTGPHLHFEAYNSSNNLIDPFLGTCNSMNPDSWWQSQPPYYDPAINKLMTGNAPASFNSCPQPETPNAADFFNPGDDIYFTSFYRDQLQSQVSQHTIYRPDLSVYSSWTHSSSYPHYAASWWYWSFFNFAPGGPTGTWRYEVVYEGDTYTHDFELLSGPLPTSTPMQGTPTRTNTPTQTPTPSRTPLPPLSQDHFLLYSVKTTESTTPFLKFGPVVLADALTSRKYLVQKLAAVGLPADKNGEGTIDPQTHLVEYKIKAAAGEPKFGKVSDVHVVNQCNDFYAELKGPTTVMVPSKKDLSVPTSAPTELDHNLDHFICYKARYQKQLSVGIALPAFPKGIQVEVSDQFQARRYDLKKITKICTPVAKSEDIGDPSRWLDGPAEGNLKPITPSTVRHPSDHLVCYKAARATKQIGQTGCGPTVPGDGGIKIEPAQLKHTPVLGFHVNNQFGPLQLDSRKEVELCIPSLLP
jgi:murein DD-endopeptidase MepM/ murein hydrolase activator NlpD